MTKPITFLYCGINFTASSKKDPVAFFGAAVQHQDVKPDGYSYKEFYKMAKTVGAEKYNIFTSDQHDNLFLIPCDNHLISCSTAL